MDSFDDESVECGDFKQTRQDEEEEEEEEEEFKSETNESEENRCDETIDSEDFKSERNSLNEFDVDDFEERLPFKLGNVIPFDGIDDVSFPYNIELFSNFDGI